MPKKPVMYRYTVRFESGAVEQFVCEGARALARLLANHRHKTGDTSLAHISWEFA